MHRSALRLHFTPPLDPSNLYGHLVATAVPGAEEWRDGRYRAALTLPGGPAIVAAALPDGDAVPVALLVTDPADVPAAVALVRRAFDLDADPAAIDGALAADPVLAPLVAASPGRRMPGTLDPAAMVMRAVLGQQVSTAAARTHAARLVAAFGEPLGDPDGGLTHRFPRPAALLADPARVAEVVRMPASRQRTLLAVTEALESGAVDLSRPVEEVRAALLALPGVGPWTADTVLMRALGAADAFLPNDLGVAAAARGLGLPDRPRELDRRARAWSPYRGYAVQHLWATLPHAVNTLPPA